MRNAILLAAGLTAVRHASAAYDTTICGKTNKFTSSDTQFIFQSNAWNPVGNGSSCVSVDQSVPAFDANWNWEEDKNNVHSFPHVRFNSTKLPTKLSAIKTMRLATQWTMRKGNPENDPPRDFAATTWAESKAELEGVVANAAWDFFVDKNKTKTYNPIDSEAEIMIWLGKVGNPYPLMGDSILTNITLGSTEFSLWFDANQRDQKVFTWVTRNGSDVTQFDEDITPLLKFVLDSGEIDSDSWLGLVEFGSEAWHSPENITFSAAHFSMDLDNGNSGSSSGSGSNDNAARRGALSVLGLASALLLSLSALAM
ncbi:concanavalin A-like lectin/glucanase domain-containing protein [Colletotrichum phormii]|uniref:Concanavalin A-like lectin/glucanase domain-containing protein n=1 Tax=Colletotrichum phormii TaxID=359342 RepID=A0AAI9ZSA1_9PEZI|nr:concanavalin A-like lectin/glucanase domain-containing protein [Colletotrichum phormii]KAK1635909.1 concanavalin A-like lectin/glucanase domain-containing protein [Colletotrichum phormii]